MVACACIHVYKHLQEEIHGMTAVNIAFYFLNHFRFVVPANTSSSRSDIIPDLECIFVHKWVTFTLFFCVGSTCTDVHVGGITCSSIWSYI